jgi:MerR family redox-sensitive transcriptional activator SoxR
MSDQTYSIGDVAKAVGVATSKLRYYDSIGLVQPADRVNGRRRYDEAALDRLTLIAAAQAVGFTLAEIKGLFDSYPAHKLSKRWRELAAAKRLELERQTLHLHRMQWLLDHLEACTCEDEAECAGRMRQSAWSSRGERVGPTPQEQAFRAQLREASRRQR